MAASGAGAGGSLADGGEGGPPISSGDGGGWVAGAGGGAASGARGAQPLRPARASKAAANIPVMADLARLDVDMDSSASREAGRKRLTLSNRIESASAYELLPSGEWSALEAQRAGAGSGLHAS
jgi:hypothetical protein